MVVVGFRCLLLAALWTLGCHEVQEAKEGEEPFLGTGVQDPQGILLLAPRLFTPISQTLTGTGLTLLKL